MATTVDFDAAMAHSGNGTPLGDLRWRAIRRRFRHVMGGQGRSAGRQAVMQRTFEYSPGRTLVAWVSSRSNPNGGTAKAWV